MEELGLQRVGDWGSDEGSPGKLAAVLLSVTHTAPLYSRAQKGKTMKHETAFL